jgi:DNA-binding LacI/PurR family transcriptional regulator
MTYSLTEPRLHRVVPHHFHNALLAVRELQALGYRRPAFVLNGGVELRTNYAYTGAMACARELVGALPPLLVTGYDLCRVKTWCRRHRPDALVFVGYALGAGEFADRIAEHKLGDLGIAVMDWGHPHFMGIAGIDQKTQLIGATAVDLLVAQLHRHERGIPPDPIVSMVEGAWVNDRSVRALRAEAHA